MNQLRYRPDLHDKTRVAACKETVTSGILSENNFKSQPTSTISNL